MSSNTILPWLVICLSYLCLYLMLSLEFALQTYNKYIFVEININKYFGKDRFENNFRDVIKVVIIGRYYK